MKITITQLRSTLISILATHSIYGARQNAADANDRILNPGFFLIDFNLSWERAWGVSASLRISIEREKTDKAGYGGRVPCTRFRTSCDIGWSSTGRDISSATAALALYRQVIDLAALIQAATDGLEEEVEVVKEPGITEASK